MSPIRRATDRTFASLRVRNYRLYFTAQAISISGTWMQWVAQSWLVLRLTGSGTALGITTALQFLPTLLAGMWGGLVADRFDKRKVLIITQALEAMLALILGVLTAAGWIELWMVYVLAFLFGCVTVVDHPARQSFVTEMVGAEAVPNAVALNSAVFNVGRIAGPAVAAMLIASLGIAPSFFVNAVSYGAVIIALVAMDPAALHRTASLERARGQLREGLRFLWNAPGLRDTMLLVSVIATFGFNFTIILPILARFTFHGGAGLYGLFSSIMAAGALGGALVTAASKRPTMRMLLTMGTCFGVSAVAAAAAPTRLLESLALIPVGATSIAFIATANSLLQLGAPARMRGRVMALYAFVFLGGTAVGGPIAGWLSEHFGARTGLGFGAALSLTACAAVALLRRARAADPIDRLVTLPTDPADLEPEHAAR